MALSKASEIYKVLLKILKKRQWSESYISRQTYIHHLKVNRKSCRLQLIVHPYHVFGINKRIIDRHNINIIPEGCYSQNQPSNPTKTCMSLATIYIDFFHFLTSNSNKILKCEATQSFTSFYCPAHALISHRQSYLSKSYNIQLSCVNTHTRARIRNSQENKNSDS